MHIPAFAGKVKSVQAPWVQVHLSDWLKPPNTDAKIKFLAADALQVVESLSFDAQGNRVATDNRPSCGASPAFGRRCST